VLARNPDLADLLLSWVVGPLAALDDADSLALRRERLAAAPAEATGARSRRLGALVSARWRSGVMTRSGR
jgi:hypothetical protein